MEEMGLLLQVAPHTHQHLRYQRTDTRGKTDKKLTSTLVIRTFLSFELTDIFKKYGSLLFFKKAKKTISILIANDEANMTP